MSFDEALRVLGIDATAGKKGARRAYLKLIKVHKPDRDPVMFRRVREAYEAVKDRIEYMAAFHQPVAEPEAPVFEGDRTALDALLERAAPRRIEHRSEPPRIEERAPEPPRIEERAPEPPRIEERAPEPPRIEERAPEPPRIEERAPDPPRIDLHADPNVRIDPVSAPPPEPPVEQRFEPPPAPRVTPGALLRQAMAQLEAGGSGVDRLAIEAFTAARRFPEAEPPGAYDAINLTLRLFANGRIVQGRRVARAMLAWLSETGAERDFMGQRLAASLAVVHAFVDLPADAPPGPVAIIAQAMVDGALESAHPGLRAYTKDSPYSALVAADCFHAHAPLLDGLFGERLRAASNVVEEFFLQRSAKGGFKRQSPERRPIENGFKHSTPKSIEAPPPRGWGWSILGYAGAMLLIALIGRALVGVGGRSSDPPYPSPRIAAPKIREFKPISVPSMPNFRAPRHDPGAPVWVNVLCGDAERPSCVVAEAVEADIKRADCAAARFSLRQLATMSASEAMVRPAVRLAQADVEKMCKTSTPPTSEESP